MRFLSTANVRAWGQADAYEKIRRWFPETELKITTWNLTRKPTMKVSWNRALHWPDQVLEKPSSPADILDPNIKRCVMTQCFWFEIGLQYFCIVSPSSWYHGSKCLARDGLSRFLYPLTFYLIPWFNVLGPGSAFKIFAVAHLPDSTVVQCVWPEISFQNACIFLPSN